VQADVKDVGTRRENETSGTLRLSSSREKSVLVAVSKTVEHPKPVGGLSIPSMVRLQPLDNCLHHWRDAPDLAHAFAEKIRFTGEDGELRVAGDASRQGTAPVGSGEVVDKVVECRAKVVDAVADKKSKFVAGFRKNSATMRFWRLSASNST
jgi:hypothetical protein